jgi:hypothetical protein
LDRRDKSLWQNRRCCTLNHIFWDLADLPDGGFSSGQEVPMTQEQMSPLRARIMENMHLQRMIDNAQKAHIRAIKDFVSFLNHASDIAAPGELRAYKLHMTDTGVMPSTFDTRIVALRFFLAPPVGVKPRSGSKHSTRCFPWWSACRKCRLC